MTPARPPDADLDHVLAHTTGLWDDLRGRRLFLTGGTGFFGRWLLESFTRANDRLGLDARAVVLSRDPEAFSRKAPHLAAGAAVQFVRGDVRSFAFPDGPFDFVIHAATDASATLIADEPQTMFDTIVAGTRRTLDFARSAGARKVLFTSSGAVYGRQPPDLTHVPEDYAGAPDPTDPRSCYGEGKRAAELLGCMAAAGGFEFKIARCFAFVGPFLPLDAHFAVGNFIRDALAGGPIRLNGDGTPYRSYLYAADLAVWLWTILFRGVSGRAYNVGSGEAVSVKDVADLVAGRLPAKRPEVIVARLPVAGRPAERYVPDVRRAAEELGLCPAVSLADGIGRTVRWHSAASGSRPAS